MLGARSETHRRHRTERANAHRSRVDLDRELAHVVVPDVAKRLRGRVERVQLRQLDVKRLAGDELVSRAKARVDGSRRTMLIRNDPLPQLSSVSGIMMSLPRCCRCKRKAWSDACITEMSWIGSAGSTWYDEFPERRPQTCDATR